MSATTRVSTWNDVLRSLSRPCHPVGFYRITTPLPPGIPGYNDFFCADQMDKVDTQWLLLLDEFRHWNDPVFGPQVQIEDLTLLATGRRSMIDLFRRGPKSPSWYEKIREADRIHAENQRQRTQATIKSENQRAEGNRLLDIRKGFENIEIDLSLYQNHCLDFKSRPVQIVAPNNQPASTHIDIAMAMGKYLHFLLDPETRLDYRGLNKCITSLAQEIHSVEPERKKEGIEAELYRGAVTIREHADMQACERESRINLEREEERKRLSRQYAPTYMETNSQLHQGGATQGSEIPPKIGKKVPRGSGEVKYEAGSGPSTLSNRSRNLQAATPVTADNITHEDLVLKDFIEAHDQRMRAHMESDRAKQAKRIKQADPVFELENNPADAAFTCPRPCPQPPIGSLDCNPDYQEAKARFRTADEKLRPRIDEIMSGKGYADDEDVAFHAAAEQWQKAADELKAMEVAHGDAQSLLQQAACGDTPGLKATCEPSYGTFTAPQPDPHLLATPDGSDVISVDSAEGGPEICTDCLEKFRNDIADIENLAREMRAEYEVARAKVEGTGDFVVLSRDGCAEANGGGKGKEPVRAM